MHRRQIAILIAMLAVVGGASASTVTVTVINNSNETVMLRPVSANDRNTIAQAQPSLPQTLDAHTQWTFKIEPYITKDVNFASVRYRGQGRSCAFLTNYVNGVGRVAPRWNHSAQGGAKCTSRILAKDPLSHDWTVEFVIF